MNLSSLPPRRTVEGTARIPILTLISVWRLAMEDPLRVDEADAVIQPVGGVCSSFRSCSFSVFLCACACLVAQSCPTLCDPMDCSRLLCPWDSSGKNTGMGCHSLLQGIFLTQGSNLCSPVSPALAGSLAATKEGSEVTGGA